VLLNGCSTRGQVSLLLEKGVPAVIATAAPVADEKARRFAARLFQALAERNSLGEAIELASAATQTEAALAFQRKLVVDEQDDLPEIGASLWGVYYRDEAALGYKLPESVRPVSAFQPNEKLIEALWEVLPATEKAKAEHPQEAASPFQKRNMIKSVAISFLKKREAVLNNFPSPVSVQLSKLFSPSTKDREAFDHFNERRLRQMDRTFQFLIEMLLYTLLAQLWEYAIAHPGLKLARPQTEEIERFLRLAPPQRAVYEYRQPIRAVADILEAEVAPTEGFFLREFPEVRELVYEDERFLAAYFFLITLRQQLSQRQRLGQEEAAQLCVTAEEALAELFGLTGFICRYAVYTIQNIDVLKFRHTGEPAFLHDINYLADLSAGRVERFQHKDHAILDNRSVLLFERDADSDELKGLNLSPFIIDASAFDEKPGDIAKIHFFHHYDPARKAYCYRDVLYPHEEMLSVTAGSPYDIVFEQWEAFWALLQNRPL
jgi:hypothetical protein